MKEVYEKFIYEYPVIFILFFFIFKFGSHSEVPTRAASSSVLAK